MSSNTRKRRKITVPRENDNRKRRNARAARAAASAAALAGGPVASLEGDSERLASPGKSVGSLEEDPEVQASAAGLVRRASIAATPATRASTGRRIAITAPATRRASARHTSVTLAPATQEQTLREQHEEVQQSFAKRQTRFAASKKGGLPSFPTHASFNKLRPAAFPSLDTRLTLKEAKEQLKAQQEAEKHQWTKTTQAVDQQIIYEETEPNPFFDNHGNYFGADEQPGEQQPLPAPVEATFRGTKCVKIGKYLINIKNDNIEAEACQSSKTRSIAPTANETQFYRIGSSVPTLWRSYVARDPATGRLVTYHEEATEVIPNKRPSARRGFPIDSDTSSSGEETDRLDCRPNYLCPDRFDMAENTAPGAGGADDATRGMPYYERLRKTLKASIKQKQELEETLAKIEQMIWTKEAAYLDDTGAGNIMKGFDNYIKASGAPGGATGGGTASRKKSTVGEQDRLFSRSSVNFWTSMREGSPQASATSTPSHAPTPKGLSDHPTPTSTTSTKAPGLKKKKATDHGGGEDSDSKPPNKRLKITFNGSNKD